MKQYKKFTLWFLGLLLLVILFHATIWNLYSKHVFPKDYHIGDLGRLSYQTNSLIPRKKINTLSKKHFLFKQWNGNPVDVLTIGDSFSSGGAGGKNAFYQDYLATKYNLNILNIYNIKPSSNYIEMIYLLKNSNLLHELKPKFIIIESIERSSIKRFSININKQHSIKKENLIKKLTSAKWGNNIPQNISFINNININALKYNVLYKYDDNAFNSNCYIVPLNKNLFSPKNKNLLLFHKHELEYLNSKINNKDIENLNKNFNDLAKILKEKNIQLYFMPAVDKFNLYSKYLVENSYGNSTFFEQLRKLDKVYRVIDTKAILRKEIDKGVKDIFYPDDTHWSYKASEAISKSLSKLGAVKNDR